MNKLSQLIFGSILLASSLGSAKGFSYDVSGSSGTRNGNNYSEVHLGLNYNPNEWLNWRNSVFSQFGSEMDSVYGLDSSLLLSKEIFNQQRTLGMEAYIGPGVRLATEKANAVFGKAGLTFHLAGIRIGGGVQYLQYFEEREDKNGFKFEKEETQYFVILSGGGSF